MGVAMALEPVKVGIVGCGNISGTYFTHCKEMQALEVVACSDIILERAKASAKKFGIPKAGGNEVVLDNGDVELVICLTPPKVHTEIMQAALAAGKHAYTEKPFAVRREDGLATLAAAAEKGLLVGGAPDTFFGGGIQTCRKLIDAGAIGVPVAATAFMLSSGCESWHPDPEFFYEVGGGPMLDMGPYYLTALVNLLGPIASVAGRARVSFPERTITSEKKRGQKITVETPTHIAGVMDFVCGAVGTLIMSFDCQAHNLPRIEIYGSEATLSVPDPNTFGGPVRIGRRGGWEDVELTHGYTENARGIGPADLATSLRTGRKHRACGELTFHVLDAMLSFTDASRAGGFVEVCSTCERPAPLPAGLAHGALDE
jgi:predicted dehydrogenase